MGAKLQRGSAPGQLISHKCERVCSNFGPGQFYKTDKTSVETPSLASDSHEKESCGIAHLNVYTESICTLMPVQQPGILNLIFPMSSRPSHNRPPSDRSGPYPPSRTSRPSSRSRRYSVNNPNPDTDGPTMNSPDGSGSVQLDILRRVGGLETQMGGLESKVENMTEVIVTQIQSLAETAKNTQNDTSIPPILVQTKGSGESYLERVGSVLVET